MPQVTVQTESKTYTVDVDTSLSSWAQNIIANGYRHAERSADGTVTVTHYPPSRIVSVRYTQ